MYPLHGNGTVEIQLDSTAARLGVEKRRMYDIINILEAIQCAVHRRKNTYLWYGGSRLNSFLKMLKKEGENLKLSDALRGRAPKPPAPKHKTLGVMAQRFLMLFLVEPPVSCLISYFSIMKLKNMISFSISYLFGKHSSNSFVSLQNKCINLEMAVRVLIDTSNKNKAALSPEQQDRQHKSKVRRLYDIANVFISVGLIEKVSGNNTVLKKPVFKYAGPLKIKKSEEITVETPPITPLTLFDVQRTPTCHVFAGKSKRKLEFTTPHTSKETIMDVTVPSDTPSHKWDEILLVADMELTKINNHKIL